MKAMKIPDLERLMCGSPGCDHKVHGGMFLHARCHIDSAVEAEYFGGVLHVRCARCRKPIADVAVAGAAPTVADREEHGP